MSEVHESLTPWDRVQLARHPQRPHTLDYIQGLSESFTELHGDRRFGDDPAIVGGLASFANRTVLVMGHQKGRDTRDNVRRNFGMPHPEGYRKAMRLLKHAEKFGFPVICFIDTPAANPNKESEERGQSNAIAECILTMCNLRVPVVATIIGEGGSGGALAIGVADRLLMLENAIYSVASPEACASILWRDAAKAPEAARALRITAQDMADLAIADEILSEPGDGAHTDSIEMTARLKDVIQSHFTHLCNLDLETLLAQRYARYRAIGMYREQVARKLNVHSGVL
ncbi:MAG: acetyl-CoA carboxylase carboxyltransferase subunit alpha [Chloroflexales bacterium]|nr:acetyl-CoA carboxylase carboxyltransferase subunit alpha [Chloroflexales bacterium]